MKYILGIFLDEKLTWKIYTNKKLNQAYVPILYFLISYNLQTCKCSLLIHSYLNCSIIRLSTDKICMRDIDYQISNKNKRIAFTYFGKLLA
jgi:hypothetical protein